jgi:hypothetical protein
MALKGQNNRSPAQDTLRRKVSARVFGHFTSMALLLTAPFVRTGGLESSATLPPGIRA